MPESSHVWTYVRESVFGTKAEGPIAERELLVLIRSGGLNRETIVSSPTRTQGKPYHLKQIPAFLQSLEAGEAEREQAKEEKRQAEGAARQRKQEMCDAERAQASRSAAAISDCDNIDLVNTIAERVRGIFTSTEQLQYLVVQQRPVINISPDAIVATNRRLIFYRPKLLGRFEFQDYQWFDLHDAHLEQHFLTSTFTARRTSGEVLTMEYLPKEAAQKLYRMAQELEEQARIARHEMHLTAARAGAAQINIGSMPVSQQQPPSASFTVQPQSPAATTASMVDRLKTLKEMADAGLITPAEFEDRKKQILAQI